MDLPIVMRQPVTPTDRWRWICVALAGGLVAGGMWLALPWAREQEALLSYAIPQKWLAIAYAAVATLSGTLAVMGPWRALGDVDYTWVISETAIQVQARYVIGQRSWNWPLDRISRVRIHRIWSWGDDPDPYCVQVRLGGGKWHSVRCSIQKDDALAFKRLVDEVLSTRIR